MDCELTIINNITRLLETRQLKTTAYHPQANGMAERLQHNPDSTGSLQLGSLSSTQIMVNEVFSGRADFWQRTAIAERLRLSNEPTIPL